ncbi:putative hydrolase [Aureliella helgolandensis]|uniref:Putative hydrolase n=2 Tax=Aureliella helgolandensis TaxID=2527968 RepID=A0A518G815_9BACT|nr:putative hydrolase [Aureliella helgolandensis]
MSPQQQQRWTDTTAAIAAERMQGQQAGHGFDHVSRVLRTARQIQTETGGSRLVVDLAALLHDVGDAKFHDGLERSAEFSREILSAQGVPQEIVEHVTHIVDNISFRKGVPADQLSLEGKIVQDADRLDALGAIGIVRTIEYGAAKGQPFYLPSQRDAASPTAPTGVGHFHEKLFKLRALLNTEPARIIALQREEFMRSFLDQFFLECDGEVSRVPDTSL